jgi:hypothetical protein
VTAVSICGTGNLTASFYDSPNLVTGSALLTGGGAGTASCSEAILTVNIVGTGGNVVDSTGVIKCPGTCSANYALGSTIGLTATPTGGSSQVTWTNCSSFTGDTCTVVLNFNTTVTATFN